jgi:spore maturation protein CgeB
MPARLRLVYIAHTLRSDWNNGNAHFLRGLLRAMANLGHHVNILEPETDWSIDNLKTEPLGEHSLEQFKQVYFDLDVQTYAASDSESQWQKYLDGAQIVILHEWNSPTLAKRLLELREQLGFRLLFHDTHHRASSSPDQMQQFGLTRFDGILAFGDVLRAVYRERFGIKQVWTLHEAADITVFHPTPSREHKTDVVWIGNWGEGERSREIREFLLEPAAQLTPSVRFTIYGVRYPQDGLRALEEAHVRYAGYLPNLDAPGVYATARVTVHIPRQQYASVMRGIPTIRVFEALACGIPLISAPWQDTEHLFRPSDLCFVENTDEMVHAMQTLLQEPAAAAEQARRGLETILARHTCMHRAQELTTICEELLP